MKKVLLVLSCMLCLPFFAQEMKTGIENQFRDYNNLIVEKKLEKALDLYANEDFLKMFPKEQLVDLMNQMFNSPELEFKIDKPENIVVSDQVVEERGQKFVKVTYLQKIQMKLVGSELKVEDLQSALQGEFGYDNVKLDPSTGYFYISSVKEAAASSSDSKNWKFTVLEKKQIPVLKAFIPEQFLRELK